MFHLFLLITLASFESLYINVDNLLGLDLASLIPANIEVEATNASVRFSSAKYKDNGVVANGDSMIKNKNALIDDSECQQHSIVNMSELLASSAAAYAHKVKYSINNNFISQLFAYLISYVGSNIHNQSFFLIF